jgi:hypothetical protein
MKFTNKKKNRSKASAESIKKVFYKSGSNAATAVAAEEEDEDAFAFLLLTTMMSKAKKRKRTAKPKVSQLTTFSAAFLGFGEDVKTAAGDGARSTFGFAALEQGKHNDDQRDDDEDDVIPFH